MASIVDAFRETFGDRLALLKLVVLTIPVYYCYNLYLQSQQGTSNFGIVAALAGLLLFGVMVKVANNIINENLFVLPSLNPFMLWFSALKAIVAIFPMVVIPYFISRFICSMINIIYWLDITLKSLIWFVFASIVVAVFLLYCVNENIREAYNFKLIYQKSGDLIVVLIFFIIQILIMNIPTTAFLGYVILVLFGQSPIFDFFVTFAFVFNLCAIAHYLGQVHYETIVYNKVD